MATPDSWSYVWLVNKENVTKLGKFSGEMVNDCSFFCLLLGQTKD